MVAVMLVAMVTVSVVKEPEMSSSMLTTLALNPSG